jgi:hypothetical protein
MGLSMLVAKERSDGMPDYNLMTLVDTTVKKHWSQEVQCGD